MSRIGFLLVALFLSKPLLVSGQESERRRVIRTDALWPVFDIARQTKGIQICFQGLAKIGGTGGVSNGSIELDD
jgi:hypothetical protein